MADGGVFDTPRFMDLFPGDGVLNGIGGVSDPESYRGEHLGDNRVDYGPHVLDPEPRHLLRFRPSPKILHSIVSANFADG